MARNRNNSKNRRSGSHSNNNAGGKYEPESKEATGSGTDKESGTATSDSDSKEKGAKINDPEWYAKDVQLLNDSASLSYSDPMGQPIELLNGAERIWGGNSPTVGLYVKGDFNSNQDAIPGVCSLFMKHTVGLSYDRNDPVNVAANAFYTHVRYVNSGRKNYDPADLMIATLAIAELHAFLTWCKRLYAYAFLYSQKNQYIGKVLVEENSVNPNDLIDNLANFRYWVNAFANKIASFVLPSDIPYFSRRKFMYDGLYLENPYGNIADQLYQFVPEGFFKFELDSTGKGCLRWKLLTVKENGWFAAKRTGDDLLTINQIMEFGNSLLSNIMGDEDFGLISGDILKAYGTNILAVEGLPEDYMVLPHYDMTVLSQFKNATVCGHASRANIAPELANTPLDTAHYRYALGDVMQDDHGNIVCWEAQRCENDDMISFELNVFMKKIISLETPTPTPADNIEATRLMVISSRGTPLTEDTSKEFLIYQVGVDYPTLCVLRSNHERNGVPEEYTFQATTNATRTDLINSQNLEDYCAFKYIPTRYVYSYVQEGLPKISKVSPCSNIDNYTVINGYILEKMHTCALLSLFFVPGVAKLINYMK